MIAVDSEIISPALRAQLGTWTDSTARWQLIFRATRDGFDSRRFHAMCDGVGSGTVTAVQVGKDRTIGGFTTVPWRSAPTVECTYRRDDDAFIFCQPNCEEDVFERYLVVGGDHAVVHGRFYGPCFGSGDLYTLAYSPVCWAKASAEFCGDEPEEYTEGACPLLGANVQDHHFEATEIEVFALR